LTLKKYKDKRIFFHVFEEKRKILSDFNKENSEKYDIQFDEMWNK
jgi:hypothetical protein